ncbi:MAG: hypothetical protein K0Q72_1900 [Armatimonadetes bacterium]|nr:hypothetical protein [Armatimonadota bacterium]
MQERLTAAAGAVRSAITTAGHGLVERESLVETIALAAVAGEHLLVIGPPGTAKSEAVRRVARSTGGRYFEYLIGRFTEPSEIFGPVDLRKLREGVVETETRGMLPEAEIAFLDEIFLGSTAILNTLLGILNERIFRRGHTVHPCPLRICVGASNALPDDEALAAFADRFLVRVFVEPIGDPRIEELLEAGWSAGPPGGAIATVEDLDLVKVQRLIAAAAVLDGRTVPGESDLWPLISAIPTREEQTVARECLRELLAASRNVSLPAAAEEASAGPAARAQRLVAAGATLLDFPPGVEDPGRETWLLKLEGIAREIDAGFAPEQLPEGLRQVRGRIVQAVAPGERSG